MSKQQRLVLALISSLLALSLGCTTIGLVEPTPATTSVAPPIATNTPATAATLAAMNATVAAINTLQAIPTSTPPPPQMVVVTATPSPTPVASPSPLPTATAVPVGQPAAQSRTIVIIVTPTLPPTATPYPEAPIIIAPREGEIIGENQVALLQWSWNGLLAAGEYFEVKVRPDGLSRSAYIAQERGTGHEFDPNLGNGRYRWTVQVVKGYFINNSGHPDDWVFEAYRSPESEPRLIIIDKQRRHRHRDDDDHDGAPGRPRSVSQAEPPHPQLPLGIALGGLAFAGFAAVIRSRTYPAQTGQSPTFPTDPEERGKSPEPHRDGGQSR